MRADKYTGGDMKVLRADIPQQPMGIVAVANDTNSCKNHSLKIPYMLYIGCTITIMLFLGEYSPCRNNNGGCQDLCLPTSDGRVNCSCRGDRQLLEDNTCSCKRWKGRESCVFASFESHLIQMCSPQQL